MEALFGDISKVRISDGFLAIIFSLLVFGAMYFVRKQMALNLISPDFAQAQGININRLNFIFLALIAVIVALGVKIVGTLLMGSLVVIPAAASKNVARNFKEYGIYSVIFGLVSAVAGIFLAEKLNLSPGPIVVLASGAVFLISLLFKK